MKKNNNNKHGETKTTEKKVVYRRRSMPDFQTGLGSCSSSSDSSSGSGGFSSSESDSFLFSKPRPVRTSVSTGRPEKYEYFSNNYNYNYNSTMVTSQSKTKSKAMKIYSDLKKIKQPISPGNRLATFINSLFNAGNLKKSKTTSNRTQTESISACSSTSSFSRSCLSNTSKGKSGIKRSVRFYPVSVIVDEDSRPCGHKSLYENDSILSENRRVVEAAKELLKNYRKKGEFSERNRRNDEDDDDDVASCASSDLFELDSIGIERYREELPVYETTRIDTNRAIASGLIL